MKKKFLGITMMAAVLTMATGMTAFAGWEQDLNGYKYRKGDGTYQDWGWFTDPDTGLEYYFDLDGYSMRETRVEGYWLDADGVKQEKTEAEIEAENARAERERKINSPSKKAREAKEAAVETINAGDVTRSTTRDSYTTEMRAFTNRAFVKIKQSLAADKNTNYTGDIAEDNQQATFYYDTQDPVRILATTFWKNSTKTSVNYVPYPVEITYNRNIVHGDDSAYFNEAFQYLVTAALGENAGAAVYDKIMAIEVGSEDQLKETGTTDTGNTYELTYRYNNVNLKVTCSEIVPASEEDETAETEAETTETTTVSESSTTSVITAGMSSTDTDQSTVSETENSETETSAEVEADDEDGEE